MIRLHGAFGGQHGMSRSDIVMPVWSDVMDWASTPLGATIVGGVAVAAILAVAARISKGARSAIARSLRWLFSIRLTTRGRIERRVERLITEKQKFVIKARWVVGVLKDGGPNEFVLMNVAQGSNPRAIHLESASWDFTFLSAADWPAAPHLAHLQFTGKRDSMSFSAPAFNVYWTDEVGRRHSENVGMYGK